MDEIVADHQGVEFGGEEADNGVVHRIDNGFGIVVKRGVQHHRDAGDLTEFIDQFPITGIGLSRDRLYPGCAVHMGDGSEYRSLLFLDIHHKDHVGEMAAIARKVVVVGGALLQHRRREGAVALSLFDHLIDDVFVLRRPRVRHDAAVTESPGSEFRLPLHPTDDRACGHKFGGFTADVFPLFIIEKILPAGERLLQRIVVLQTAAPIQMAQPLELRFGIQLMVAVQGGSQGAAGVVGGGLYKHIFKEAGVEYLAVQCAIVGNTAGQTKIGVVVFFLVMAEDVKHDLFQRFLQRRGDVFVVLVEGLPFPAAGEHEVELLHLLEVDLVPSLRQQRVKVFEQIPVHRRIAVWGQAHDFVFVELFVAQHMNDMQIIDAQRILHRVFFQHLGLFPVGVHHHAGDLVPLAVDGEHQTALEARHIIGAYCVGDVMVHEIELFLVDGATEFRLQDGLDFLPQRDGGLACEKIGGYAIIAHLLFQDKFDGVDGKFIGVLDTVEPLLFDGGDHLTVHNQDRGGVVLVSIRRFMGQKQIS